MIWIITRKSFVKSGLAGCIPLKLIGMKCPVNILDIVNLLLLYGSPKIAFAIKIFICIMFQTLADNIIFPKSTAVLP